jgi:hypothetical protein
VALSWHRRKTINPNQQFNKIRPTKLDHDHPLVLSCPILWNWKELETPLEKASTIESRRRWGGWGWWFTEQRQIIQHSNYNLKDFAQICNETEPNRRLKTSGKCGSTKICNIIKPVCLLTCALNLFAASVDVSAAAVVVCECLWPEDCCNTTHNKLDSALLTQNYVDQPNQVDNKFLAGSIHSSTYVHS